jgi:ribose 5-phosphate isomerase B
MKIAVAADHAGFSLKARLRDQLRALGHEVLDLGTDSDESTDYPDYAAAVGHEVVAGRVDRGFLFCSTGVGMAMAANKIRGVRAALAVNDEEVRLTRDHNDANVLTFGAKFVDTEQACRMAEIFIDTAFSAGARHQRRIEKMAELEHAAEFHHEVETSK